VARSSAQSICFCTLCVSSQPEALSVASSKAWLKAMREVMQGATSRELFMAGGKKHIGKIGRSHHAYSNSSGRKLSSQLQRKG